MNRQAAESFIIRNIGKLTPGSDNAAIYKKRLSAMSDDEFDTFMDDLSTGKMFLPIIEPNFDKHITVENNLQLAEELGHEFFEKLWVEGDGDNPTYLSPIEYLVIDLPIRRASQTIVKKISVPDDNKVIDNLTAQPTGASKGAKISYPELQVAAAMGMENSMVELTKYRGGDIMGRRAYETLLSKTGIANQKVLEGYSSGVESTKTLKTFLTSMMLKNTL